jgi:hypothetical protein
MTRASALRRVAVLYLFAQLFAWVSLQAACSEPMRAGLWRYAALGPLAAVLAIPRFRYHSLLGNLGFVALCVALLVAPFAYAVRPGRVGLAVSVVALAVWVLFGLGFSVHHM